MCSEGGFFYNEVIVSGLVSDATLYVCVFTAAIHSLIYLA